MPWPGIWQNWSRPTFNFKSWLSGQTSQFPSNHFFKSLAVCPPNKRWPRLHAIDRHEFSYCWLQKSYCFITWERSKRKYKLINFPCPFSQHGCERFLHNKISFFSCYWGIIFFSVCSRYGMWTFLYYSKLACLQ